ncbi:hypothetical protein dsx2_1217 [Desulfovibrio sp. X2]|uniref:hypothetical protein n=1 Tax=Desulfovibrio sp. X2 TaxID=941449 RepID=UPI00035882E8|nr:hypothetical protein [Desulfovibrio sp. X2]EPR36300.1 hypothetical protein dsx2_1217 [Desulfovibrio sp. X2]
MRHLMGSVTILALVLLLAGCATRAKYEEQLDKWVGMNEAALVTAWGAPDAVYETAAQKFLTYKKERTAIFPGSPATYETRHAGDTSYMTSYGGTPTQTIFLECRTTFVVDKATGKVEKWSLKGNDCVSD